MSSKDEINGTSPENKSIECDEQILPPKSRQKYIKTYDDFMAWKSGKQVKSFVESIFILYFDELSKKLQPSTLWSVYSMLKTTVRLKHDIDIESYMNLTSLLRRLTRKTKKSKDLSANQAEGDWESGYNIQDLIEYKSRIFKLITQSINIATNEPRPSTSMLKPSPQPSNGNNMNSEPIHNIPTTSSQVQKNPTIKPGKTIILNIQNCSNITINFK